MKVSIQHLLSSAERSRHVYHTALGHCHQFIAMHEPLGGGEGGFVPVQPPGDSREKGSCAVPQVSWRYIRKTHGAHRAVQLCVLFPPWSLHVTHLSSHPSLPPSQPLPPCPGLFQLLSAWQEPLRKPGQQP